MKQLEQERQSEFASSNLVSLEKKKEKKSKDSSSDDDKKRGENKKAVVSSSSEGGLKRISAYKGAVRKGAPAENLARNLFGDFFTPDQKKKDKKEQLNTPVVVSPVTKLFEGPSKGETIVVQQARSLKTSISVVGKINRPARKKVCE